MKRIKKIMGTNIEEISFIESNAKLGVGDMTIYFYAGHAKTYRDVPEGIYEGASTALSCGSYLWRYVVNKYPVVYTGGENKLKRLEHHKDTTLGLWATDVADAIGPDKQHLFFKITYEGA